ncbi:RTA1 domain-containing protein [Flagelloscypha sp. PMI_526]|nr:RTA1 domain-containing protein [Flagelloscypha sp. PMI_526]
MPKVYCDAGGDEYPYYYCPSLPAAKAFTILFGISTIAHFIQAIIYRKGFCWVIIMAAFWEDISFVFRWLSVYDISPLGFGSPAQLLAMLAPLWINAFCYMVLGRVILYFLPEQKVWGVGARRLSLIFVLLDILAFLVQASGGVLASIDSGPDRLKQLGLHIYQGGVGLQEFFVVIFTAITIRTHLTISRFYNTYREENWKKLIWTLYVVLILITIRIIYRIAEYTTGFDSGLIRDEKWFYILEAGPMLICLLLFNIIHPGTALIGPESEFPKKEKKKKKSKKHEKHDDDIPLASVE